jgi:hypothetical protein
MKLTIKKSKIETLQVDFIQFFTDKNQKNQIPIAYNESLTINNISYILDRISLSANCISINYVSNEHIFDFFDKIIDENTVNPLVRKYTAFKSIKEMVEAVSYTPTIRSITGLCNQDEKELNAIEKKELSKIATLYNQIQKERGSTRRAYEC